MDMSTRSNLALSYRILQLCLLILCATVAVFNEVKAEPVKRQSIDDDSQYRYYYSLLLEQYSLLFIGY